MREKESTTVAIKKNGDSKVNNKYPDLHLPERGIYSVAVAVLGTVARLSWGMRIKRSGFDKKGGQFIAIANHHSAIDWILVDTALYPKLLNVVITNYHYSNPKLRFLLKKAGCIAKDQFTPDITAVKKMLTVSKMGGNIMVFPEGRTTPSGKSETFERSIVKLIRHLGLPLVGVRIDGEYLTFPKWSEVRRKGRIDVNVQQMLSVEQIKGMTDDEIYDVILRELYSDEYAWQAKNRVRFRRGDDARGLEGVLYMCPRCGAEYTMTTHGSEIKCSACGNGARLDKYYTLTPLGDDCVIPENIGTWFEWEKAHVKSRVEEEPDYEQRGMVTLNMILDDKKWLEPVGEGEAVLNKEGFRYVGTRCGEEYELFIPLAAIPAIAFGPNKSFELYRDGVMYSF
ncbi:MAG: 1-acyl-sn-glycerol-3-phosphate acyltransferase, partial [Clostridia bacterium]|nr:1-acyl-sn-glycerol-3-phosphate acyltransferase [Clostridia bacterium]